MNFINGLSIFLSVFTTFFLLVFVYRQNKKRTANPVLREKVEEKKVVKQEDCIKKYKIDPGIIWIMARAESDKSVFVEWFEKQIK